MALSRPGDGAAAGDGERDTYRSTRAVAIRVVSTAARHFSGACVTRRRTADGIGVHRRLMRAVASEAPDRAARMLNNADCIWRAVS